MRCSTGLRRAGLADAARAGGAAAGQRAELERVHPTWYLDRIEGIVASGGGRLDPDTYASPGASRRRGLAAGAGLTAVEALRAGRGDAAFCAVRPPGHHATRRSRWASASITNVAVVAATLADSGRAGAGLRLRRPSRQRHADIFYDDPRVLFVSIHQWPLYPGTGRRRRGRRATRASASR